MHFKTYPLKQDGSITAGAQILTGRVEYNLEELEEMERLMKMLKRFAKEGKFMEHAAFWWDKFKQYMKDQAGIEDWRDAVKDESIRVHLASESSDRHIS